MPATFAIPFPVLMAVGVPIALALSLAPIVGFMLADKWTFLLHRALLRFEGGARSERPALVAMGRDYVEFLRFHARLEERTVFVEAESLLGEADWAEIERAFEERTDPVFGPRVDSEFRALYQHIKNTAYLKARGTD